MPQLAFCHNCNAEVHLIRRPVIQSPQFPSQQFELEEVCPRCTQNCFEYIDDQQQQSNHNSNRQQQSQFPFTGMNPFNPFSFLQMLDPIQAMVGGIPGMGLFAGLNGADDNDLPAILRLIEQREMVGQSPTDPAVLASLKHIPVTAEWINNEKKKQRDEKIAREQLEMHEKLQQQGIESGDIPITPTILTENNNNNQDEIIDETDDITLPDCKICLCEPELGEELIQLPCNHLFHTPCLESWAKGHNTCPTCRFKLPLHLENSTQTQTLPNGTQIRISTHHIDLTTPNAANPDQFNASFFGPRAITQRLTIDSHEGRSVESSAGTPVQLANARLNNNNNNNTTNTNSSQAPIITTATTNSNTNTTNSNLQSTMINGARHIPQPDGSTVIIDRTGIRIRAPDGSTRLIGTQHTLSQISAQNNNNNNNSTPNDQSTSNNTSVTTTMNDSQPQTPTLSSKSNPQTTSQLTLNTSTPPVRKGTGGGVYGQRFQRLPSSAHTTTPATAISATTMTDSTTNNTNSTQDSSSTVLLTSPTITTPSLTSPQPKSNPFKKNFRPK